MGILTTLQAQKFVPAEKLSSKFQISVRTVYRDIRALDEIGVPVAFEAGRGYFVADGYFLPPVSFSADEANALVLLSSLAGRFADDSVARQTMSAIEKIRAILKAGDKERSRFLSEKIRVLNPNPTGGSSGLLGDIQKAISGNTILKIEYTDAKKQRTSREIEPIGIIYYTEQWHLIGWCWLRKDYRDFIVRQIDSLKLTGQPFRKTEHISLDEHIRSWGPIAIGMG
jgi:predicted DNA-binding transcriptional regulator YafY